MKMEEIYGNLKLQYYGKLVIMKAGSFYRSYDGDALILWKIFGYKINNGIVSFPASAFGGVVSRLNRVGISVIVSNNDSVVSYESTLTDAYCENLESAKHSNLVNNRINEIKDKVMEKLNQDASNYKKISEFLEML